MAGSALKRGVALAVLLALVGSAEAHDVRGEALLLDIGDDTVAAELHVPVAQLALAGPIDDLGALVREYVSLESPAGERFGLAVDHVSQQRDDIVYTLHFTPPANATAHHFTVRDDLVLRGVVNANAFVFSRRDLKTGELLDAPTLVGTLHYQQRALGIDAVPPARSSWLATYWPWLAALLALLPLAVLAARRLTLKEVT